MSDSPLYQTGRHPSAPRPSMKKKIIWLLVAAVILTAVGSVMGYGFSASENISTQSAATATPVPQTAIATGNAQVSPAPTANGAQGGFAAQIGAGLDKALTPSATTGQVLSPAPGTPVPVVASVPQGTLKVQYYPGDRNGNTGAIVAHFQIINTGNTPVPMSSLKLRYWFTNDGPAIREFWCDYAEMVCSNVTARFSALTTPVNGADTYLEIGFTGDAGDIPAGGSSGEIKYRFSKVDGSAYNQGNDYSFDASRTAFADWNRVTLYLNGKPVWGTEPR